MFGSSKSKRGSRGGGRRSSGGSLSTGDQQSHEHYRNNPPPPAPPPQPPGLPIPVGETIPWLLISVASYAAFLYLPGRVQSPRARVTLIGGNEFINVASHLHFCVWVWLLQDLVFRICAILLFPPKRAAVYFLQMFVLPASSPPSSTTAAEFAQELAATLVEGGASSSLAASPPQGLHAHQHFLTSLLISVFRWIRALLVSPAPSQIDFVPPDYKVNDVRTHGGVERGSSYWHYHHVCIISYVIMFAIWLWLTYVYHTRHVIRLLREKAEARKKGLDERRKQSAKVKRDFRKEVETKRDQILKDRAEGKAVAREDLEQVEKMLEQLERGEKNLAEDEFSDEDVDYDPYGRPVPDPPFVPTVSWMVLWSMVFCGAFAWVQALPILMSQLFPVGVCGVLAFCVLMPQ